MADTEMEVEIDPHLNPDGDPLDIVDEDLLEVAEVTNKYSIKLAVGHRTETDSKGRKTTVKDTVRPLTVLAGLKETCQKSDTLLVLYDHKREVITTMPTTPKEMTDSFGSHMYDERLFSRKVHTVIRLQVGTNVPFPEFQSQLSTFLRDSDAYLTRDPHVLYEPHKSIGWIGHRYSTVYANKEKIQQELSDLIDWTNISVDANQRQAVMQLMPHIQHHKDAKQGNVQCQVLALVVPISHALEIERQMKQVFSSPATKPKVLSFNPRFPNKNEAQYVRRHLQQQHDNNKLTRAIPLYGVKLEWFQQPSRIAST